MNHHLLKNGFLLLDPHDGQIFAFFAIGVLQFLHTNIFGFFDIFLSSLISLDFYFSFSKYVSFRSGYGITSG